MNAELPVTLSKITTGKDVVADQNAVLKILFSEKWLHTHTKRNYIQ